MKQFNIVSLIDFLSEEELSIVIESFAEFSQQLTQKHHKKINLILVCDSEKVQIANSLCQMMDVYPQTRFVTTDDQEAILDVYRSASFLFMPVDRDLGEIIPEALAFSIPFLCFEEKELKEYLDHTCCMFVSESIRSHAIEAFANYMTVLYFDPEVRKLLKKGARSKFNECFDLNRYENADNLVLN